MALLGPLGCGRDPIPEPAGLVRSGPPVHGDAYVEASLGDASRLNPLLATDSASGTVNNYLFNGLVKYDKDLRLVGDLAESFEVRDGGREVLFRLRRNVRWHDGRPFTSDDVRFTFEKLRDPAVKTPFGADFELVRDLQTPDPWTVRVRYTTPFVPALESWGMGIVPRHVYGSGDFNAHPANRRPIGTGPFRFSEWRTDEKIVLTAYPEYFEGRPHFDRVIIRVIPDSSVQFLELRNQSIDAMGLTPDQYGAYPEFFEHYNKFRYPSFSYSFFAFNLAHPFFKDPLVREALAFALDKKEIVQGVLLGFGRGATGPFPPQSWAFDPDVKETPFDPDRARRLLDQAGWRDGNGDGVLEKDGKPFRFTCITNQGNKMRELTGTILQSQFKRVGIDMELRVLEWSTFIHNYVDQRRFDAMILGWNLSRDPDQYVIWHSSQQGPGKYNFVGYANPEADRLLEEGRRTFSMDRRRDIYHRLHRLLAQDRPYLFLYYPEALPTIHRRIQNVAVAPAGLGWNFREWFVPKALQRYHYAP